MRPQRVFTRLSSPSRKAFTGVLVNLLLLVAVFSSAPLLHQLLHADALASDHECVIGAFAAGHVASGNTSQVVLGSGFAGFGVCRRPSRLFLVEGGRRSTTDRAPPRTPQAHAVG